MNVDVSIHEGSSAFQVGIVAMNDQGEFIAGENKCIEGAVSVLKAEQ